MFSNNQYKESKYQISGTSGSWLSTTSFQDITNQSVTIRTDGRPIFIGFIPDGSSNAGVFTMKLTVRIVRNTSTIIFSNQFLACTEGNNWFYSTPCSSASIIDNPGAGNYTYKAQASHYDIIAGYVKYIKMVAYLL